jgi:uncharacterized protein (TIGR00296 family)
MELSDEDCNLIVGLARKAITDHIVKGARVEVPEDAPPHLKEKCGVFVTLNRVQGKKRYLRGCIGFPEPVKPLLDAVIDAAISAAVSDPRFEPLKEKELDSVEIEISVLTPPELIKATPQEITKKVEIGRDGLIAERGWNRGLLLPQVPVEEKWDVEEFLMYTCLKAGLEPDCWWDTRTKFYSFRAIVFGEDGPKGRVKRRKLLEVSD